MAKPKLFQKQKDATTDNPYKWGQKVDDHWVDLQCAYTDVGIRCEHRGTLAPTTNGHGPWYCRDHAWVFLHDRHERPKQADRDQWAKVKDALPERLKPTT